MGLSDFSRTVFALVQERVALLGFRKRKPGLFSLEVSEDVLGLIGLNKAVGRGRGILEINPVVGVRNQCIERLVAELVGEPFDELSPFSAGANVGYLSPNSRYQCFIFKDTAPLDGPADQLADMIQMYGLPFIHSNASLTTLLETMRSNRAAIQFLAVYRIPVALYLLGRCTEVGTFLHKQLATLGTRTDQDAERFRVFAEHLMERTRAGCASRKPDPEVNE